MPRFNNLCIILSYIIQPRMILPWHICDFTESFMIKYASLPCSKCFGSNKTFGLFLETFMSEIFVVKKLIHLGGMSTYTLHTWNNLPWAQLYWSKGKQIPVVRLKFLLALYNAWSVASLPCVCFHHLSTALAFSLVSVVSALLSACSISRCGIPRLWKRCCNWSGPSSFVMSLKLASDGVVPLR